VIGDNGSRVGIIKRYHEERCQPSSHDPGGAVVGLVKPSEPCGVPGIGIKVR